MNQMRTTTGDEALSALWQSEALSAETLRFDRRHSDRWPENAGATAFVLTSDAFGHMHELRLTDRGHAGLGAMCEDPIAPGTVVSVGFESPGIPAERGEVVRCVPCGSGYRLGIRYSGRLAA